MASFLDNCGFIPTAGGTTDWTYSSTVGGYQSPTAAGAVNGATYTFRAQSTDLTQWEIAQGTYNSGTGVFARTTVLYNSLGTTAKVSFLAAPSLVAIVPVAKDVSNAARTRTVLTSGSGTYTTPVGCKAIDVRLVGGGAGGQGNSSAGLLVTGATAGGNTTFGTSLLVANGGPVTGSANNYPPTAGGTASGGDINMTGAAGGGGQQLPSAGGGQITGGSGAASPFGSGGQTTIGTGGSAGVAPGSGGGGGGASSTASQVSGAGGSAGGYCQKLITSPSATYSYVIGAAGSAGTGLSQNGGAGAPGIIVIDEYY